MRINAIGGVDEEVLHQATFADVARFLHYCGLVAPASATSDVTGAM